MEYADTSGAIRKHVDAEDKQFVDAATFKEMAAECNPAILTGLESPNGVILINESGLYSLMYSSRLPEAKKFRRWILSEVLPSIRQFGYYGIPEGDEVADILAKLPPESVTAFVKSALQQTQDEIDAFAKIDPLFKLLDYCCANIKVRDRLVIKIAEKILGEKLF